jgi:integrase
MPKRTRLATGVYQDRWGLSVVYQRHGKPIETRFPRGSSVDRLTRWRARQITTEAEGQPTPVRNQLARDAVRYLKRLKGMAGYKSERSHLKAWLHELGPTARAAITRERCELVIATWRQAGYAPRTIRHRHRVLQSFFHFFEGARAETPLDDVKRPAKPKPRPVSVADMTIAAVAFELRKHEILGTLRDAKTRARFLVRMTHSQRPIEFQRAEPGDVDLERRLWFVRGAKGGYNTVVPLNDEQVAAWQLYKAGDAWGAYDSRSFAKTLRRAGWPKGIRPYNLRHSTGFALDARGVDLGDIQGLMGHASPETTRMFYAPGLIARLAAATEKLSGRFPGDGFAPILPRAALPRLARTAAKVQELASKTRRA